MDELVEKIIEDLTDYFDIEGMHREHSPYGVRKALLEYVEEIKSAKADIEANARLRNPGAEGEGQV